MRLFQEYGPGVLLPVLGGFSKRKTQILRFSEGSVLISFFCLCIPIVVYSKLSALLCLCPGVWRGTIRKCSLERRTTRWNYCFFYVLHFTFFICVSECCMIQTCCGMKLPCQYNLGQIQGVVASAEFYKYLDLFLPERLQIFINSYLFRPLEIHIIVSCILQRPWTYIKIIAFRFQAAALFCNKKYPSFWFLSY